TWPSPGHPAVSSTALFAPYRPMALHAEIPCRALGAARARPVTVLATGLDQAALTVTDGSAGAVLRSGDFTTVLPVPSRLSDCRITLQFGPDGLAITDDTGTTTVHPGQPVPEVFG